ncbi:MAG: hypothetical protein NXI32_03970, partial [bacterium]|nr:hypothetical protein [bacterium]
MKMNKQPGSTPFFGRFMTHRQLLTRRAASVVALVVLLSTLVVAALRHELSNETDGSQLTHR